jgi:hypothetical protein
LLGLAALVAVLGVADCVDCGVELPGWPEPGAALQAVSRAPSTIAPALAVVMIGRRATGGAPFHAGRLRGWFFDGREAGDVTARLRRASV